MSWLPLAVIGHLLNAASFLVDKSLLSTTFKRSATYAALMGMVSALLVVMVPFVRSWPPFELYPAVIGFGGFFVLALWAFFEALRRAEPSRVVPIVGSFIPLFTLVGMILFFHESLTKFELIGFAFLLLATWLLTQGEERRFRLSYQTVLIILLAAFLFAAASLCGAYAFDRSDFLGVLVVSRLFAVMVGLLIGLCVSKETRYELWEIRHPSKKARIGWAGTLLALGGQIMGGGGFVLVHLSMAQGNPAIVNALQAVQYAALVLVAWFGGTRLRSLLHEPVSARVMIVKSCAILSVGIGLALVSRF